MLTDGPFNNLHPTWSGDSRKIAFASDRDGDWEIYVLDLATRPEQTDRQHARRYPARLVQGRWADCFRFVPHAIERRLFTMAADGSDVQQVTGGYDDHSPSWSRSAIVSSSVQVGQRAKGCTR
ncbi:MAG: PD40 domain-containing protein [Anaerolineae bacterium]|nr:MAG: PD40 domain-containing protein [Anaerolineae bacterium]